MKDRFGFPLNELYVLLLLLGFFLVTIFVRNIFILRLRPVLFGLLFSAFGIFLHSVNTITPEFVQLKPKGEFIFETDRKLNSTEKNRRYFIDLHNGSEKLKAVLSVPKDLPEFDFAHLYRAELLVNVPKSPENDFQFDYAQYLARQKVFLQCYLPGNFQIAEKRNASLTDKMKQHRFELLKRIENSGLSDPSKNFLKGIILADRTEMDKTTVQDFNRSGLTHFLAISGTHIVIVFWMLMLVFNRIFPAERKYFGIVSSLVLIWFFSFYIGLGNSVLRSCIMITVYYMYVLLQRKPDLLHSLSLAGMIILFINTQQLFDVGFQLSFLAVFGIFWLNQPILNYFPFPKNFFQKVMYNTFSISLSAQLVTVPFALYYFHQFSWMSLPANFLIVPFSEIVIVSSFLLTLLFGAGTPVLFLEKIYDVTVDLLLRTIHWFAAHNFAFFKNIPITFAEVLYCFALFYFLRFLIMKFNFRNVLVFISMLAGFFILRFSITFYESFRDETVVANYFKNEIVIDKKGNYASFYYDKNFSEELLIKNIVDPYLASRRIQNYKLCPLENKILKVNNKSIKFKNKE